MKKSITKKLRKLFIVNAMVIIFLIIGSFSAFEIISLKSRAVNNLTTLADVFASTVSTAIVFEDRKAISETLKSLKDVPQIYASIVTNKDGKILSYYIQAKAEELSVDMHAFELEGDALRKSNKNYIFSVKGLQFYKTIVFNDEVIGIIHLFDNLAALKETISYYILISILLMVVLIVAVFFISDKQQILFTKPILILKTAIDKVTKDNIYNIQVPVINQDEIGDLIIGFNTMLSEIDRRDKEIEENNKIEERKNKEYVKKLEEARLKAEELSYAKSLFVANMSHEIRTPMNGVMGIIELLGNTPLNERQLEYVQIAKESSNTLLSIINDILDFSKIEAKQVKLESLSFNLRKTLEQTSIQFNIQAHKKGIELLCNFRPEFHSDYDGDELKLKQILHNLIGNAIKFTVIGQVEVGVSSIIDIGNGNDQIFLYVKDTGNGIEPENIHKIFNPFDQGDNSTTRKFGGTGLGLSICKNMIELMKGHIVVESVLGAGSSFNFMIELKRNKAIINRINDTKIDLKQHRALVIDDNLVNCQIVSAYLKSWGIENHVLTNALEGVDFLDKSYAEKKFCDIAILDHYMPELDGLELASKFREKYPKKNLTLILLSSLGSESQPEETKSNSPLDGFLTKPVSSEKLLSCLTTLLCNRGETQKVAYDDTIRLNNNILSSLYNSKILVAEDYEINQKVITMMLKNLGCQVTIAKNGEEAFALYQNNIYDLVFMDCQMPVLDGFDATKKIRVFEKSKRIHTPIVALTANVTKEDHVQCLAAGMDDFVTKPFSEKDLVSCLEKFINKEQSNTNININTNTEFRQTAKQDQEKTESSEMILNRTDLNKLLALNKDSNFSKEIIALFLNSTPEKINIILHALNLKKYEEIKKITHMLKSSSAMLGAAKLTILLKDIDKAIKEDSHDETELMCKNLHAVFEATSLLLQPYT